MGGSRRSPSERQVVLVGPRGVSSCGISWGVLGGLVVFGPPGQLVTSLLVAVGGLAGGIGVSACCDLGERGLRAGDGGR